MDLLRDGAPGGRRILVIDDDRDLADSLTQLLRLEGYVVTAAYSAEAALRCLDEVAFAIALVDIRLGQRSGVELIAELRSRHGEIAIIMMTAYASVDTAVEALQEGAYDYLCKPFFTEDLLATLERCFERQQLVREKEQADAAVLARNLELKMLNARLGEVLWSVQVLSRCTTTRQLCTRLVEGVTALTETDGGALYLGSGDTLRLETARGVAATKLSEPASAWARMVQDALERKQPMAMSAGSADGEVERPRSFLIFPLLDGREFPLGAIIVHAAAPRTFTQQDIELGQILTSFGAEALQAVRAAEGLAQSEERLRKVIDNSPSAISLKALNGRYLLTNGKFEEWFGALARRHEPAAEDAGPPGWDRPEPDLVPDAAVIKLGRAMSRELEVTLADGAKHWILVTKFPVVDGDGKAVGVGTIGTDVTERRVAEERLRQAQRLEAMGQLTGGVAHDFNNLLAVILGNLRLLQEEIAGQPELEELLGEALEATKAGADLTGRLLAFGRGQPLNPRTTDIRKLVREMARMLERTLGEGIVIRLDLAPDLWHAEVDRNQLESSILNLALNARDAMPEGGELAIRAANACLEHEDPRYRSELAPGRYVALSVQDAGEGMTPEVRQNAVQPFFTTKAPGCGSGLGLSMVYGFVAQSSGHLDIVSDVGRGTTVTLHLPASPPGTAPSARREGATQTRPGRGERILVVEDQPSVRRLMRRLLGRLGYDVLEAPDGGSALEVLERDTDIAVLFTDIVLPGATNGFALGRQALAAHPSLRVIYTTGYSAESVSGEVRANSRMTILRKPVQVEELSRALRDALKAG